MTKEEIIQYVLQSPENTNSNVLKGMLDEIEGIKPSGTIKITENGIVNITEYANADVDVPTGPDVDLFPLAIKNSGTSGVNFKNVYVGTNSENVTFTTSINISDITTNNYKIFYPVAHGDTIKYGTIGISVGKTPTIRATNSNTILDYSSPMQFFVIHPKSGASEVSVTFSYTK